MSTVASDCRRTGHRDYRGGNATKANMIEPPRGQDGRNVLFPWLYPRLLTAIGRRPEGQAPALYSSRTPRSPEASGLRGVRDMVIIRTSCHGGAKAMPFQPPSEKSGGYRSEL